MRRAGLALPPLDAARVVRGALVATIGLTLAMALPWPAAWPALRFLAGVASAFALVYSAGWCAARLATWGAAGLGGVIFAGPGAGIIGSGLVTWLVVAAGGSASTGWLAFAAIAAFLTAAVWRVFEPQRRGGAVAAAGSTPAAAAAPAAGGSAPQPGRTEIGLLVFAYGLAGFGYIITATFLPVIARQALPGSAWNDLFWPLFGAAVVVGALASSRLPLGGDLRPLLAVAYLLQAAGIGIGLAWPSLPGFVAGSLLVGMPFTAITFLVMQEVRRLAEQHAASRFGLATALYGIGQIAGPALVAWLLAGSANPAQGFDRALLVAAAALLAGAALHVALQRLFPMRSAAAPAARAAAGS